VAIDFGVSDAMDAVARAVDRQRCILFLGAAVHSPPPPGSAFRYPEAHRPPGGRALSMALAAECRLNEHYAHESRDNLQRVSLFYELGRSRKELIDAVTESVQHGKRPSPVLRALAEMDFPLVITTNYDSLFEEALRDAGKQPRVSVYSVDRDLKQQLADTSAERPIVLKLHGDVAHPETIVITDEDYIDFVGKMSSKEPGHPFPLPLRELLVSWMTLFVGYSLADYNLRLLFRTLRWRTDPAYASRMYSIDRNPDALIRDVWENERRYLRFVIDDVWSFVPGLYRQLLDREMQP
jgi:SIR2-like domain